MNSRRAENDLVDSKSFMMSYLLTAFALSLTIALFVGLFLPGSSYLVDTINSMPNFGIFLYSYCMNYVSGEFKENVSQLLDELIVSLPSREQLQHRTTLLREMSMDSSNWKGERFSINSWAFTHISWSLFATMFIYFSTVTCSGALLHWWLWKQGRMRSMMAHTGRINRILNLVAQTCVCIGLGIEETRLTQLGAIYLGIEIIYGMFRKILERYLPRMDSTEKNVQRLLRVLNDPMKTEAEVSASLLDITKWLVTGSQAENMALFQYGLNRDSLMTALQSWKNSPQIRKSGLLALECLIHCSHPDSFFESEALFDECFSQVNQSNVMSHVESSYSLLETGLSSWSLSKVDSGLKEDNDDVITLSTRNEPLAAKADRSSLKIYLAEHRLRKLEEMVASLTASAQERELELVYKLEKEKSFAVETMKKKMQSNETKATRLESSLANVKIVLETANRRILSLENELSTTHSKTEKMVVASPIHGLQKFLSCDGSDCKSNLVKLSCGEPVDSNASTKELLQVVRNTSIIDKSKSNDDDDDSNERPSDEKPHQKLASFLNNLSAKQLESFEQRQNMIESACISTSSTFETHESKVLQQSISIAATPTDVELELRDDGPNMDEPTSREEECRDTDIFGVESVDSISGEWTTTRIQHDLEDALLGKTE